MPFVLEMTSPALTLMELFSFFQADVRPFSVTTNSRVRNNGSVSLYQTPPTRDWTSMTKRIKRHPRARPVMSSWHGALETGLRPCIRYRDIGVSTPYFQTMDAVPCLLPPIAMLERPGWPAPTIINFKLQRREPDILGPSHLRN